MTSRDVSIGSNFSRYTDRSYTQQPTKSQTQRRKSAPVTEPTNVANFEDTKKRKGTNTTSSTTNSETNQEQKKKRRRTADVIFENEEDSEEEALEDLTELAVVPDAAELDISPIVSEDYVGRPRRLTRAAARKNGSRAPVTTDPEEGEEEDDEDFETKPAPQTLNTKKATTTRKKTTTKKTTRLQKKEADQQDHLENLGNEITKFKSIIENFSQTQTDPSFGNAILAVVDDIINEISLEVCFEVHKKLKNGSICMKCDTKWSLHQIDFSDVDIFGKNMNNYTPESFNCNNEGCNRVIAASRYAPHLEKCMGLNTRSSTTRTRGSTRNMEKREREKSTRLQKAKQSTSGDE